MKMGISIRGFLKSESSSKNKAERPEEYRRNLYSPIFRSISGINNNIKIEVVEPRTYIKATFFSPEKTDRKLEFT